MYVNSPSWMHYLLLFGLLLLLVTVPTYVNGNQLLDRYEQLETELEENGYGIPVYILSNGENSTMQGEIYGIIDHPYETVRASLTSSRNWCDIVPLHLNIKACTYQHLNGSDRLTFYTGRKFYEKADEVYQIAYIFTLIKNSEKFFQATLTADNGPMGTSQYNIQAKAIPLTNSKTFIYFSYSYKYNLLTEIGMNTYLATLGSDKVGFSIIEEDEDGQPIYIDGVLGIIERNSVRYYFSIKSYLDTLTVNSVDRFEARLNKWFDLTEDFKRQLYELDRKDYLEYKRLELKDQQRLQSIIDNPGTIIESELDD